MPYWRAGSSPGAALVERGIDGVADSTGLRREPAAVGRPSRALNGTEGRRSAACPRRRGGGRARASARRPDSRFCPQRPSAGQPRSGREARCSRQSCRGVGAPSPQPDHVYYSRSDPWNPVRRRAAASGVPGRIRSVRRGRLASPRRCREVGSAVNRSQPLHKYNLSNCLKAVGLPSFSPATSPRLCSLRLSIPDPADS